jgi:hypothetical protein
MLPVHILSGAQQLLLKQHVLQDAILGGRIGGRVGEAAGSVMFGFASDAITRQAGTRLEAVFSVR